MKGKKLFLIAGILAFLNAVLLNLFVRHFVFRVDFTQNKIYTLHRVTKEVLDDLDDLVTIEIYMSSNLPPEMNPYKQDLFDLLEEYRNYGKGYIRYAVYHPDKDPDIKAKVRRLGIPEMTFNVIEKDQVKVVNGHFGLAIFYKDKKEIVPILTETENLEYDLTLKILKLQQGDKLKNIGIVFWNQKRDDYSILREELDKIYNVRNITLTSPVKDDISVLLLVGSKKLSERELYFLDQYIMKGGKTVWLLQPVNIDYGKFTTKPLFKKDLKFLEHYGINVVPNLVQDPPIGYVAFMIRGNPILIPYYYFVKIVNHIHHFSRHLEQLVLTWPSAIDTLEKREDREVNYSIVLKTTKNGYRKEGGFVINPLSRTLFAPDKEKKEYILSVICEGKFNSIFVEDTSLFRKWKGLKSEDTLGFVKQAEKSNSIVFVGNAVFLQDPFVRMYPDNLLFIMNILNAYAYGKDLTQIKAREIAERPIKILKGWQKFLFQNGLTFGIPIIILILGIIRFTRREKRKRMLLKEEE